MFVALAIVALVSVVVVVLTLVISRAAPDEPRDDVDVVDHRVPLARPGERTRRRPDGDVPRGSAPDRARHGQR
jgi:hypothetical protein